MVNVKQIPINLTLPMDEVSVVEMQPYLELQPDESFKIRENLIDDQLNAIQKTLALAQNSFNDRSAHFTIFPEYSVPGLKGLEIIDQKVSSENWSKGSVILAGVHGLTKDEYGQICETFKVTVSDENKPENIPKERWINCCFIWIKQDNGEIKKWLQLKIRPSWPENNVPCNDMFCGSTIYVFKYIYSNNFISYFTNLICFDWVTSINGSTVGDEILNSLNNQSNQNTIHLDLVFVIQHNDSPNHTAFLSNTSQFLNNPIQYPFVDRKDTVIFHVNTAVSDKPSKKGNGAFSACVFSSRAPLDLNGCRPTFCMQPEILRGSRILKDEQCKDVIFREMGQCIHRFKIRISRFLGSGPANRTHPISDAEVHALTVADDPRLSGKAIPASLKWFNDSLDGINSLASISLQDCPLHRVAEEKHAIIVNEMRLIEDGIKISKKINWAACFKAGEIVERDNDRCKNPDMWDYPVPLETYALEHTVYSLTNLGLAYTLDIKESSLHGTLTSDDLLVQVITIKGNSFSDCCIHFNEHVSKSANINDPILVVARDKGNHKATEQEFSKYYEPNTDTGLKYLDYQTLVNLSRNDDDVQNLKEKIDEYLPSDRKII